MTPEHLKPKQDFDANLYMFGAVGMGLAGWSVLPAEVNSSPIASTIALAIGCASVVGAGYAAKAFYRNYLKRKSWEILQTPDTDNDDRTLTEEERFDSGMREPTGRLIGRSMDGKPLFLPTNYKPAFSTIIGGQGTGKTVSSVMNSTILTPITSDASTFIIDIKKEILPSVIRAYKQFGYEVICSNVGPEAQDTCPSTETPPFELVQDSYTSDDQALYQKTNVFIRGYAAVVIAEDGGSAGLFFAKGGRKVFYILLVYLLVFEPHNVTPTRMKIIADDEDVTIKALERMASHQAREGDTVAKDAIRSAKGILRLNRRVEKYLVQFLDRLTAEDALACYDLTGPLANWGQYASARISDLRKRKIIFAAMTPLDMSEDLRVHTSLQMYNFIQSVKAYPTGRRVHGILDEFTTFSRGAGSLHSEQITLRALGFSADVYVQTLNGLIDVIGERPAKTIIDQSDIVQMSGLSHEDSKTASEMIGTKTVRRVSGSIQGARFDDVSLNFQDYEVDILKPQKIAALPRDQQIVKVRGLRPEISLKAPYWDCPGLKELIDVNPLEGPPPKTDPTIKFKITADEVKVLWWKKEKHHQITKSDAPEKERFFRLSSFLWFYAWLALFALGGFSTAKPVPHFYMSQTHQGCEYVSITGKWATRRGEACLPVWIKRETG